MDTASETRQLIENTARRILSSHCASEQLKAAEGSWNETLWRELDEVSLTRAFEPEGNAELDVPIADALHILRIAGSYSTPAPLAENMLANWIQRSVGLPQIAGPLTIAPVNTSDRLELKRANTGWRLSGTATRVPWARFAKAIVIAGQASGRHVVALVPAAGFAKVAHGENLAREARDAVTFDTVLADDSVVPFAEAADRIYALGAAMRVLQMTGALDAVLRLTVQYVQDRKQFGRSIGKFQAVQQSIAVMAANIAASRAAANSVTRIIAESGSVYGIAAAKLRTNEAATIAARIAHQLHGAMGFTQEYELHFLTKRLWSWRDEFGNESLWSTRLGSAACERGADNLWAFITSEMS